MAYKMKSKSTGGVKGKKGLAKVILSTDETKVKVIFKDEPNAPIVLDRENCPDCVKNGKWFVSLNSSEDTMFGIYPEKGTFEVKVKNFPGGEDGIPEPKLKFVSFKDNSGKDNSYEYEYFMVVAEIVNNPSFEGMEVPLMFRYNFDEIVEDGEKVVAYSKPRSKYTSDLADFFDATGVLDFGAIRYSDNILPEVQKRILQNDRSFMITFRDGWMVNGSIMAVESPDETTVPWEENTTNVEFSDEEDDTGSVEFQE
jgi:hypothetical protein